ncbi:MAG: 30S ribosomal protein S3 [Methanobacteriota archaeon]
MAVERKLVSENLKRMMMREYLAKEAERAGFGGVDIQRTPMGTRITLVAERPGFIIGRRGATIKRLTDELSGRFALDNPQIEVQEATDPSLNPQIMAQKLAEALERGWHFRRAGHSTLRRVMDAGARGCLVVITGKLTGGRSRMEKFNEGHIKFCGEPSIEWMHRGYAVARKKLGAIGVKVAIMDPNAKLPDEIEVSAVQGPAPAAALPSGAPGAPPQPATEPPAAASPEGEGASDSGRLTDLSGIGKAKAKALEEAGFVDYETLATASVEELAAVEGIGPALAKKLKEELKKMGR